MQKKENRIVRNIVTIAIVVLMIGSVIGYMIGRGYESNLKYKGYKFLIRGNKLILNINKIEIDFDYSPASVEDIDISPDILEKLSGKVEIDSTYENSSKYKEEISVVQYDLEKYFNAIGIYFVKGMTEKNNYGMPVIRCENATAKIPVIFFKESNETRIFAEDGCIIVEANSKANFIRAKDRLIYGLLGVIKNE